MRQARLLAQPEALRAAGKHTVFVVDDNLIGNKKAIKAVLREVIAWQEAHGYPLTLATEASVDLAEDDELMQLMADANIATVFVGIETPNEAALRETKKIQNLADSRGTMLEKVHRIQQAGMEVWSGMIVGFDNDDAGVFESQRRFVQDALIVNTMVNMLVASPALPSTPGSNGKIGLTIPTTRSGAEVTSFPKQLTLTQLRDGCAELMPDLYAPAAYFGRLDTLYLQRGLWQSAARSCYLRRHPVRALAVNAELLIEALATIWQLMRRIPDAALRRECRHRLWQAFRHRPEPAVLQVYALKCVLHFHAFMMAQQMMSDVAAAANPAIEHQPKTLPAAAEPLAVSA